MLTYGPKRVDFTLQPVSGKAIPLFRGEVLRITQLVGEQCVDFNAFNLHDYKEYLSVSATRSRGFRVGKGDIIWSVQSRNRPMFYILELPGTCMTELLGGRCHFGLYDERSWPHTNCMDTLAQAVGEFGLTADDVHDSFNLWMNTEWDSTGRWWTAMNTGRKGDYVDLLALFDTLAVPAICGSGDIRPTSNFSLKPIRIEIFEPSEEVEELVERLWRRHARNTRSADYYRIKDIKRDRELRPIPGYEPQWINFPIVTRTIPVTLSSEDYAALQQLKERGLGHTDGEALRAAFFSWNMHTRFRAPLPIRGNIRPDP